MAGQKLSRQSVRFAENVAVLSLLNTFPSESSRNPRPHDAVRQDSWRTLSFGRECCLASGLAFLAEISDDPNHIVATCVEEKPDTQGLAVLLAINKENPASAEGNLKKVKHGLQDVFSILSKIGEETTNTKLEYKVYQVIVRFCGTRILKRIGSKRVRAHHPIRGKTYLGNVLEIVKSAVVLTTQRGDIKPEDQAAAASFMSASENLRTHLEELEGCSQSKVDRNLEELILLARRLSTTPRLASLLHSIPCRLLNPSTGDGFLTRLDELTRYYEFSRHLCQTAKKNTLLRQVDVITVSLDPGYFTRPAEPAATSSLHNCLVRCGHGEEGAERLCEKLGVSVAKANAKIVTEVGKVMMESKIHAEIQILTYYELNPSRFPPRVICSNKDACYLCNEFIKIHGKFHIPKTHGKLYPGWLWPALPSFGSALNRMNQTLESKINSAYRDIVDLNERPVGQDRSERAAIHFSTSMSTLLSMPSRPVSPISVSQASALGNSQPQANATSLPFRSPGHSLQSIMERPARLPTPEESEGSDVSTVRAASAKGEERHVATGGETSPGEASHSEVDAECLDTISQGKLKAGDEAADPDASQTTVDEVHCTLGTANDSSSAVCGGPGKEIKTPRSAHGPKDQADAEGSVKMEAERLTDGEEMVVTSPITLTRGVVVSCHLRSDRYLPSYTAGGLTIIPEFARDKGRCELHIEWLTDVKAGKLSQPSVTDVQTLEEEVDVDSGSRDCVVIRHADTIIKIDVVMS